jgi:small subunit ribosomal protein S17
MNEIVKAARTLMGQVVSNKMDKTIAVLIEHKERHELYGKYVTKRTKVFAHDEKNECTEGMWVIIESCRPLSKNKSWRLVKIVD